MYQGQGSGSWICSCTSYIFVSCTHPGGQKIYTSYNHTSYDTCIGWHGSAKCKSKSKSRSNRPIPGPESGSEFKIWDLCPFRVECCFNAMFLQGRRGRWQLRTICLVIVLLEREIVQGLKFEKYNWPICQIWVAWWLHSQRGRNKTRNNLHKIKKF